jgi:sortase B
MGTLAGKTLSLLVKVFNGILNNTVLIAILTLLMFAGYALWDSDQLYQAADKAIYEVFKPTILDEGKSFQELQAINSEVIAWLTVYGTNIDYPVTQGDDNMKYVNINAEGEYSMSGAIFLDCENASDFSDFNNILYGHHMEKKAMFGDIGSFVEKDMFDTHKYGNLYVNGRDYGIEFFSYVHTDAYDAFFFTANVGEADRSPYLNDVLLKSMYRREMNVTTSDRIILLSTCSATSTNGRDILIGRIVNETFIDPFIFEETDDGTVIQRADARVDFDYLANIPKSLYLQAVVILLALYFAIAIVIHYRRNVRETRDAKKALIGEIHKAG